MNIPKAGSFRPSAVHLCCLSSTRSPPAVLGPATTASRLASRAPNRDVSTLAKQEDDLDAMMAEDMQQFGTKQTSKDIPGATTAAPEASGGGLKDTLDKILIGDFFFIVFALLWFGVGVGLQVGKVTTGPLDVWYLLWQPVFQPALGVLMVGALVSGFTGKKEQ